MKLNVVKLGSKWNSSNCCKCTCVHFNSGIVTGSVLLYRYPSAAVDSAEVGPDFGGRGAHRRDLWRSAWTIRNHRYKPAL